MDTSTSVPARQPKDARVDQRGRTLLTIPKVRRFLNLMIEGEKLKDAALQAGLRVSRARQMMKDPAVRKAFFSELEELQQSERARNILLAVSIRDSGMDPSTNAAGKKVALEAARYLDGEKEGSSITINGGQNVIAGYVINLDGPSEGPRSLSSSRVIDAQPLHSKAGSDDDA